MALMKLPECGNAISDKAEKCHTADCLRHISSNKQRLIILCRGVIKICTAVNKEKVILSPHLMMWL